MNIEKEYYCDNCGKKLELYGQVYTHIDNTLLFCSPTCLVNYECSAFRTLDEAKKYLVQRGYKNAMNEKIPCTECEKELKANQPVFKDLDDYIYCSPECLLLYSYSYKETLNDVLTEIERYGI